VEANSTGGQGSRRAVAPSDDDDDANTCFNFGSQKCDKERSRKHSEV
jgi:hypothetical protein